MNTMVKYTTSTNIVRDVKNDIQYIPTPNSLNVFKRIAKGFNSGQHSFNIIGSYGTGKSSFLWALERNLDQNQPIFEPLNGQFNGLKKFNFFIPCRWYDYNDNEKLLASAGGIYGKTESGRVEATENVLNMIDQMKGGKKTDQMKCGKESTESCTVKPKVESKITVNENEILNLEAYVPFSPDALLTMYKAKFFNNDLTNYVFLKNRNYLKFKKGQKLTFEDIKELSERHFFGLPLHNRVDVDRLKKIKKEYFEKKKKLKKSS